MVSALSLTPTTRFSNRAENYVKYRPGYPEAITPFLEQTAALGVSSRIADIGSGTGLFAEPLLQKGYTVICIEPNEAMRKAGEERLLQYPGFISRKHRGEATGLRHHSLDLVTVAQAFHWLDPVASRREFARILKPSGVVVLAWNIQKTDTDFLQAYSSIKEHYRIEEPAHPKADEAQITDFFAPYPVAKHQFPNLQWLNFDALKGQLLSSSYIPLPGHVSYESMMSALIQLFVKHNENGFVKMEFDTLLYTGRLS